MTSTEDTEVYTTRSSFFKVTLRYRGAVIGKRSRSSVHEVQAETSRDAIDTALGTDEHAGYVSNIEIERLRAATPAEDAEFARILAQHGARGRQAPTANVTEEDARLFVFYSRTGRPLNVAGDDYLMRLHRELLTWAADVQLETNRRIAAERHREPPVEDAEDDGDDKNVAIPLPVPVTIGGIVYQTVPSDREIWKAVGPQGGKIDLVRNVNRRELFAAMRGSKTLGWYRFDGQTFTKIDA